MRNPQALPGPRVDDGQPDTRRLAAALCQPVAGRVDSEIGRATSAIAKRAGIAIVVARAPGADVSGHTGAVALEPRFALAGRAARLVQPPPGLAGAETASVGAIAAGRAGRAGRAAVDIVVAAGIVVDGAVKSRRAGQAIEPVDVTELVAQIEQALRKPDAVDRGAALLDRPVALAALGIEVAARQVIDARDALLDVQEGVRL